MKLVAATIREEPAAIDPWAVDLTFRTPLIARRDWKALHRALAEGDIPVQTHVETRRYATREIAEKAVEAMGGTLA